MKNFVIKMIATFCFIGRVKIAPGTLASFVTCALMYFAGFFFQPEGGLIYLYWLYILLSAGVLFIVGVMVSSIYVAKYSTASDPQEIVIDEVVGQMLATALCAIVNHVLANYTHHQYCSVAIYLVSFIFFRIFDIFKPWPVSWIDQNVKGGLGVMLDDVMAAFFAAGAFFLIMQVPLFFIY
jgi:phosphatidylglycerophosphatase A